MQTVWTIMLKDLRLRLRSPLALIVYLIFPFVFSGIMALAFGRTDQVPRFAVALVDQDQGPVAGLVRGALGHEEVQRYFAVVEATIEDARRLIERNKISGAIVIPEGFSRALFDGRSAQLGVIKNPAEAIGPVAVEEAAAMIARLLDGAATILAEPLAALRADAAASRQPQWSEADVAAVAVQVHRCLQSAQRFAFPPVLRLARAVDAAADSVNGAAQPGTSQSNLIFRIVLPGMATFSLLILALGFMADIPRERRAGTLARQLAAPVRPQAILAGKMLATTVLGLAVAAAMAAIGAVLLGVRANPAGFGLLCLALLAATTGLLALIYGLARSEQQGGTLSSIIIMVMSLAGGSWIPLSSMPAFMSSVAPLTINYWAICGFQSLIMDGAGIAGIAQPLLVLGLIAAASLLAGGWIMQRRMLQGA